jgi:predicted DNA-binding protein
MTRTQIYLTPAEAQGVARVAATTGRKQSEVIREAIDQYLERLGPQDRLQRLRVGCGIWRGRDDIDLREIRGEFERF